MPIWGPCLPPKGSSAGVVWDMGVLLARLNLLVLRVLMDLLTPLALVALLALIVQRALVLITQQKGIMICETKQ